MGKINCKFCGAANDDTNIRCHSCNALLPARSNLSEKDKESLSNYIKSLDLMLKSSQDKADGKIWSIFIVLAVIGILSVIGLKFWFGKESQGLFIIISVIWGFILFITFGAFVSKYHNQAVSNEFKTKIRFEIKEYLTQMSFTEADFKTVASETLTDKSLLIKYLPDL